jgi:hypothetical protein
MNKDSDFRARAAECKRLADCTTSNRDRFVFVVFAKAFAGVLSHKPLNLTKRANERNFLGAKGQK